MKEKVKVENNKNYIEYLEFAEFLADKARQVTLSYFRKNLMSESKSDNSPVTIADKETEQLLRDLISRKYPKHSILGEEQEEKITESDFNWILDPIDGTKNFIAGVPLYGTLIALLHKEEPILSIIDAPALDERWVAVLGGKTKYKNIDETQIVETKTNISISNSILCSTDYSMFTEAEHNQANKLREKVNIIRYNGDCYLYGMLASGLIDIVLEADLKAYDFLPLIRIVEQAGGVITDWQGNKLTKTSSQVIACANKELHQKSIKLLN